MSSLRPRAATVFSLLLGFALATAPPAHAVDSDGSVAEIGGSAELSRRALAALLASPQRPAPRAIAPDPEGIEAADAWDAERAAAAAAPEDRASQELDARNAEGTIPLLLPSPAPTTAFDGPVSDYSLAADTSIAVSETDIVLTNRNRIAYLSKAGTIHATLDASAFFAPLHLETLFGQAPLYYDNRVLFDAYRHRFWVSSLAYRDPGKATRLSKFVVAVSKTRNPLDGWYLYWWDAVPGDGHPGVHGNQAGDGSDYPSIGIDAYGFYESNVVCKNIPDTSGCNGRYFGKITFFPAAPLAAGAALPAGWSFYGLQNPDGSPASTVIQPAIHHGDSGGSTYFVSRSDDPTKVVVWRLRNHLTATQTLENAAVTVAPLALPSKIGAVQKGSFQLLWATNLGTNALRAVYRNGNLYATFNDAAAWYTSAGDAKLYPANRLVRVPVGSFPNLAASVDRRFGGTSPIYDPATGRVSCLFPSVDVNQAGDMVVVYGRTASSLYPEASYSVYPAAGPDIGATYRLRKGDAPLRLLDSSGHLTTFPIQLHDLDGAAVDPFDDTAVWIAAPYGAALTSTLTNANWGIAVGKILGAQHPDLIQEFDPSVSPSTILHGKAVALTIGVRNQGDGSAVPSTANVSLQRNGGALVKIGTVSVHALAPGSAHIATVQITIPAATVPGTYQLIVDADATNVVAEYSGVNNRRQTKLIVQ